MTQRATRIAILGLNYAPEPTGNAPYTASLAEGLAKRGAAVRVLTTFPHYPAWEFSSSDRRRRARETALGVIVERIRHYVPSKPTPLRRIAYEVSYGLKVSLVVRWGNPDVVLLVSPSLLASWIAMVRSRFSRKRPAVGVWVQDLYSLGVRETGVGGRVVQALFQYLEASVLNMADGVAVIHDRFRDYVTDQLHVSTDIEVIRNWTHLPEPAEIDRGRAREDLGWGDSDIVALHAGNMGVKQGLLNLVEVARLAMESGSAVRVVLMGDGNQREILEEASVGVSNIQFIKPLPGDKFQAALAAADVLVVNELPGLSEMSVPSKLTSYFAAGRPVIAATDEGSVTAGEVQQSGGGIVVAPGDPAAFLGAVENLHRDESRIRRLALAGMKYRHDVLGANAAIDRYARWLGRLAAGRGQSLASARSRDGES